MTVSPLDKSDTPDAVAAIEVRGLVKHFPVKGGILQREVASVQAVDGISFAVQRGETLGIVGESGCGKSTAARLLVRLIDPDAGELLVDGRPVGGKPGGGSRSLSLKIRRASCGGRGCQHGW